MLIKIRGINRRADCCEVRVEYDQWIGLDEPQGLDLLKKLRIVGVTQWQASAKPAGRLDLMVPGSQVAPCIRLIKHVFFQHFPDATVQALYPYTPPYPRIV
jgi:hypothetical protein